MKRCTRGFTLIEIAIVLVIIGLLLGGVLKGQELITGARVRNLISQQDGIKAAFFGFQDRYRALPGDYAAADSNINCGASPCAKGNGNGRIESTATPINGSVAHEETLVWSHLTSSGFLNGSYTFADTAATDANTPKNPYGALLDLENDQQYGPGTGPFKHNLKTGAQLPAEILSEVDPKIDDGLPYTGAFQFSSLPAHGGGTLGIVRHGTRSNHRVDARPLGWTQDTPRFHALRLQRTQRRLVIYGKAIRWEPRRAPKVEVYQEEKRGVTAGDRLRWTRNDRELGRRNGEVVEVISVDAAKGVATVRGSRAAEPLSLTTKQHWEHAYASTIHAAQGTTADRVLVHLDTRYEKTIGSESFYVSRTEALDQRNRTARGRR